MLERLFRLAIYLIGVGLPLVILVCIVACLIGHIVVCIVAWKRETRQAREQEQEQKTNFWF